MTCEDYHVAGNRRGKFLTRPLIVRSGLWTVYLHCPNEEVSRLWTRTGNAGICWLWFPRWFDCDKNTRKWRDPTCWNVYLPTKRVETFSKCVRAVEPSQWCIAKKITYARAEPRADLSQVIVQAMQFVRLDPSSLRIFAIQRSTSVTVVMGQSTVVHELHERSCV